MKNLICCLCLSFIILSCKNNQKSSESSGTETTSEEISTESMSTAERIAYENGYENWKNVEEIQFTFNVDRGEKHSERSWIWKPKTSEMVMMNKQDTVNYNRKQMDSISKKTDAAFINDQYWLLAPFNLAWGKGMEFSEKENVTAPISNEKLNILTITYGNVGGYTPGDAYDFYYNNDYKIKEWNYRQGNDSLPTMTTTWEDYKDFNGIKLATMHKDSTGSFKLYFTNISVK